MKFSKKQVVIGGAAALAIAVGGGAAFAYWTSTGTSTGGNAAVGTSSNFTVVVNDATGSALTPGGGVQTVGFTVTNPSTGQQQLSSVTASVESVSVANNAPAGDPAHPCSTADFQVGTDLLGTPAVGATDVLPTTLPDDMAPSAVVTGSTQLQMVDQAYNQDNCQGATVTVRISAA